MTHPSPTHPPSPSVPGPPKHSLFSTYARIAVALAALTWDVATDIRDERKAQREFAGRRSA